MLNTSVHSTDLAFNKATVRILKMSTTFPSSSPHKSHSGNPFFCLTWSSLLLNRLYVEIDQSRSTWFMVSGIVSAPGLSDLIGMSACRLCLHVSQVFVIWRCHPLEACLTRHGMVQRQGLQRQIFVGQLWCWWCNSYEILVKLRALSRLYAIIVQILQLNSGFRDIWPRFWRNHRLLPFRLVFLTVRNFSLYHIVLAAYQLSAALALVIKLLLTTRTK